jgi:cytochrome c biogenesis protein ResB
MINRIFSLFWSTKVALVLLVLILLSCAVGVILPREVGSALVFSSLWFSALLVLLILNIVFCTIRRIKIFRLSKIGTTIFHLSLVLLCAGVVYDQLFFLMGL